MENPIVMCYPIFRKNRSHYLVVSTIHEHVTRTGNAEFDIEVLREEYNRTHPEHSWNSDRIREDLFKRKTADFDRLFDTIDAANGRYRMKI